MKKFTIAVFFFICNLNLFAQIRSFNDIFPNINEQARTEIFSQNGYVYPSRKTTGYVIIGDQQITNFVLSRNPGYVVESISVIKVPAGSVSLLDIYNALGNIRELKGIKYDSYSRGNTALFEDATRIISPKQTSSVPDPAPTRFLPKTETIYIKLRDVNFGNTFYRSDLTLMQNGLRYTLTNFRNISFLFIPVIREENFVAQLYIEPVSEGILLHIIGCADISDFLASRIHINSAISKRLEVFHSWAASGIISASRGYQ